MDITTTLAAFGLSGAAGLNAWLPLFLGALLDGKEPSTSAPFDSLSSTTTWLIVLGLLTTADFVGDKIPAVDHVLHAVGTVIAPTSGALLFTGQTGLETDIPTLAAVLAGGATAEASRAAAALRPAPAATAGPAIWSCAIEDIGWPSALLLAAVAPVLGRSPPPPWPSPPDRVLAAPSAAARHATPPP